MRVVAVVAIVLGFWIAITAYVVLSLHHIDTGGLVLFISGAATMALPQLLNLIKQNSVHEDVKQIRDQTNGPLTVMGEDITAIKQAVENGNEVLPK